MQPPLPSNVHAIAWWARLGLQGGMGGGGAERRPEIPNTKHKKNMKRTPFQQWDT